jgi:hypothetical protein
MDTAELERQVAEFVRRGIDEPFARFCAEAFSRHDYPPEGIAAARMHLFYLRLAIELLLGEEPADVPFLEECRTVTRDSRDCALESGRPFCEVFVEKWCAYWAGVL